MSGAPLTEPATDRADLLQPDVPAPLAPTPLKFLPRALLVPRSVPRSIFVGWPTAFLPSILLIALISLVTPDAESPKFAVSGGLGLFMLVVFAPVLETLVMGGVLLILLRFLPPALAVVASALGWAVAHSLDTPIWGLVIWWPFLVFSTLFVAWRERSLWLAFVVPAAVHGLHNFLPALPVAFPDYFAV